MIRSSTYVYSYIVNKYIHNNHNTYISLYDDDDDDDDGWQTLSLTPLRKLERNLETSLERTEQKLDLKHLYQKPRPGQQCKNKNHLFKTHLLFNI